MSSCKYRVMDRCKKYNRPCIFSPDCFEPEEEKHMTNADRIRAMSDEELANVIARNAYTGACNDFGISYDGKCCHDCEKCDAIIKWLQQPAEEG